MLLFQKKKLEDFFRTQAKYIENAVFQNVYGFSELVFRQKFWFTNVSVSEILSIFWEVDLR